MLKQHIVFKSTLSVLSVLLFVFSGLANADAAEQVNQQCGSCHQLQTPASQTLQEKMQDKAPTLHYAGHKYQPQWLQDWLQNPRPITPSGGSYWADNVVVTDEGDEVDESKLQAHVSLDAETAEKVTAYMMTLQPYPHLIGENDYLPKKVPLLFAQKDFRKFKGCAACHRDEADFGGVTGPELYSAMQRLQPAYIYSFTANPTAWEPHTMMPQKQLNEASVLKLMNYLHTIAEEAQ